MLRAAMVGVVLGVGAQAVASAPSTQGSPAQGAASQAAPQKDYDIELMPVGELAVGKAAELRLSITPKAGWVLKLETPFSAVLIGAPTIALAQTEFGPRDFVDPKTAAKHIKTTVTPNAPGEHVVESKASFFLCNEMMCQRYDEKVLAKLAVKG